MEQIFITCNTLFDNDRIEADEVLKRFLNDTLKLLEARRKRIQATQALKGKPEIQ